MTYKVLHKKNIYQTRLSFVNSKQKKVCLLLNYSTKTNNIKFSFSKFIIINQIPYDLGKVSKKLFKQIVEFSTKVGVGVAMGQFSKKKKEKKAYNT